MLAYAGVYRFGKARAAHLPALVLCSLPGCHVDVMPD